MVSNGSLVWGSGGSFAFDVAFWCAVRALAQSISLLRLQCSYCSLLPGSWTTCTLVRTRTGKPTMLGIGMLFSLPLFVFLHEQNNTWLHYTWYSFSKETQLQRETIGLGFSKYLSLLNRKTYACTTTLAGGGNHFQTYLKTYMRALHPKIEASRRTFMHDSGLFLLRVCSGDDVSMFASRNVSHVHTHEDATMYAWCT
jgi:hypothetical protein